ncbi:MAG: YIP1 family protein [Chthoniobacterales bacterium]
MIHVSRSGAQLGIFDEARVREGLTTGEFIGTDLGWTQGMAVWRPLAELESFGGAAPPPAPSSIDDATAPEAAPAATLAATPTGPPFTAPVEAVTGLPWENRAQIGFLTALFETIVVVLMHPSQAFRVMRREGGLGDPVLYALIMGTLGAIVSFVFSFVLHLAGLASRHDAGFASFLGFGIGSFVMLLLMPIVLIVLLFIGAGITHLCLMLLGGANRPFETTLRVIAYASGSANLFQLLPICGAWIAGIYSIVLNCIGLAEAHQTDTWRAVLAVLLPMIVCCGAGVAVVVLMIGTFAGAAGWNH